MKNSFLAGLTRAQFMRRHWQKKPLLARGALRDHAHAVTRNDLFELAQRDDVESRIVVKSGARWNVSHGPFSTRELARLPRRGWTLLVQGVEQKLWQAARLMREFEFIPHARLDDVMVSYAAPGGGVGPHFDSYDVFLLQGAGERRWRVSAQRDLELVPDLPLKILRRFEASDEWIVAPGDLLYLPPRYAHDGVAIGECITYSIGFRAPGAQELALRFLEFLEDRAGLDGLYSDPDLQATHKPGRLPAAMTRHAQAVIDRLRWSAQDVERFLGAYLTEPKPNVVFTRPARPRSAASFCRLARERGVRLALATRMLYARGALFVNGEESCPPAAALRALERLADRRELAPHEIDAAAARALYDAYRAGYIELRSDAASRTASRNAA